LGQLSAKHLLELRRHLAPRIARSRRRPIEAFLTIESGVRTATAARRLPVWLTVAGAATFATAHVRIAVDPAAATTASIPLAVDRRGVRASAATRAASTTRGSSTALLLAASSLFGNEVFRDLGLVEVLVVRRRSDGRGSLPARDAELRIPDRAERRRAGCARSRGRLGDLVLLVLVVLIGIGIGSENGLDRTARLGLRQRFAIAATTATPTASATATATATAGLVALGRTFDGVTAVRTGLERRLLVLDVLDIG
jgi:hypothetical protein